MADNPALRAACEWGHEGQGAVVALFLLDDQLRRPSGANRLAFLSGCLGRLDRDIGGRLTVRAGRPAEVVPAVAAEADAEVVVAAADFGPYGWARDQAVAKALARAGRRLELVGSSYAVAPGSVTKPDGSPYVVFTPYYRAWRDRGWPAPVPRPRAVPWMDLGGLAVPAVAGAAGLPPAGEAAARRALARFLSGPVYRYADDRDRPALDGTSRLSAYLKWGCLHPRQVLARLGRSPGEEAFRRELAFREFYAGVLAAQPRSARRSMHLEHLVWDRGRAADDRLAAWQEGRTGVPIVDAGMRQLRAEGWMPNRVRMIAASYLVKDLHVDWRRGARWFMDQLVDGDLASNQHNWQWVAGTGTDAAPYFRIFNPATQARTFDPEGSYVRRWVPELRGVDGRRLHRPDGPGVAGYPAPLVDHQSARRDALTRYEAARQAASG